jgi:serine/threonine protein kinase/tetratricopeptide (TPR) repeat protein
VHGPKRGSRRAARIFDVGPGPPVVGPILALVPVTKECESSGRRECLSSVATALECLEKRPGLLGTTVAHYHILEKIGEGGMGVVYRAEDLTLRRQVALKFLADQALRRDDQRRRFLREAQAAAALDHPNICPIYAIEELGDQIFIAMALAEGENLKHRLTKGPLPIPEATHIALQVARGLEAAHAQGIIHRDVKSANIMVTEKGHARVTDFGLAKLPGVEQSDPTVMLGTPGYMSPEQVRAEPLDLRTDVWSWGIVCYEMLTGRRPFRGDHPLAVAHAILQDQAAPPSSLNPAVPRYWDRIVARALEKSRDERFPDMGHVVGFLELGEGPSTSAVRRLTPPPRGQPSIAVLPFLDLSPEGDQEFFCDGIAEEILNGLTRIGGLRTASRTSAFAFKGQREDVRSIGSRLGVETVLEGSVRKAGRRLRISAQLIDAREGYHLWSESFDRELSDVFAIQEEIAQRIVQALRLEVTERELHALSRTPTHDMEAYQLYLRGRHFLYRTRRQDLEYAIEMFERAAGRDPQYARAHAGTADCYSYLFSYFGGHPEDLERARAASARALELGPDLAESHAARGLALSLSEQFTESEKEFEVALLLDPRLYEAHYFYARACLLQGKWEQAARLFEEASRVKPEDAQSIALLGLAYRKLGLKSRAEAAYGEGIERARRHLELNPDDARVLYLIAQLHIELGDKDLGLEWGRRARALGPEDPYVLYGITCLFTRIGEVEEAARQFELAVGAGFRNRRWIEMDPDLDPIRDHPRYRAAMASLQNGGVGS